MGYVQSLSHTKWECKYHVVWIPKYRKKSLYVELRKYLGSTFKDLAIQKECQVIEGHLLPDHIHLLISIPPKYSVSQAIGYLKGKSAIQIARTYMGRKKNLRVNIFGHEVTLYQQLVQMKRPSAIISSDKRMKIVVSTN